MGNTQTPAGGNLNRERDVYDGLKKSSPAVGTRKNPRCVFKREKEKEKEKDVRIEANYQQLLLSTSLAAALVMRAMAAKNN